MDGSTAQTPVPTLDQARAVLAAQPFSRMLGAELGEFSHAGAELRIRVRPELLQQDGLVHGGVLSYAADNALTFAAGTVLGGVGIVTRGFAIDYLRPARGETLRAVARVVDHVGRQAVCRCEILTSDGDGEETLCAVAQGTINRRDTRSSGTVGDG